MNTKFFIDAINKPFVRYNVLHGTKYRLNHCGLLVAGAGALAGASVYAITDKPVKKYLIPSAVVVGSASMLLLLTRNNYSLKNKIVARGVEHVKGIVRQQIQDECMKKNNLYAVTLRFLEYADTYRFPTDYINSSIIDNIIGDPNLPLSDNESFTKNITKLSNTQNLRKTTDLLYAFINGILLKKIEDNIYNTINKKKLKDNIEIKEQQQTYALENCNINFNYYSELLMHTRIFIYLHTYQSYSNLSIIEQLCKNLKGIASDNELLYIKYIALEAILINESLTPEIEKSITLKLLELIELQEIKLANFSSKRALQFQLNIKKILFKYNLKINDNGALEFLNQDKLINYLPE